MLVAGYLGYALHKRDHRKEETKTDMFILMLVYGLLTALILQFYDCVFAYASIISAPIIAYSWLKWGAQRWQVFLYSQNVSHNVNDGDVWKTLSTDRNVEATEIVLYHNDGSVYMCELAHQFNESVFAPFRMDEDGIVFYVTVFKCKDGEWEELDNVKNADYGDMITYFSRNDIKMLEMRLQKK